jgi:hypothetical protein
MSKPRLTHIHGPLLLAALVALPIGGCGGGAENTPAAAPLDREKLAAALPQGVTLETRVRPDKRYGESAKTVEDALKSLLATVRDNTIYDLLGHEIRFESPGKARAKTAAKPTSAQTVVYLAK